MDKKEIENKLDEIMNYLSKENLCRNDNIYTNFIVYLQKAKNCIEQLENKVKELEESRQTVIDYIETKIEKNNDYLKNKYMNVKIRIRVEAEQTMLNEILDQIEHN